MKTRYLIGIIILVVNLVFVGSVSAQMSLLQTSPADGDVGVALDATLSFTFNQPIDENAEFPFEMEDTFFLGIELHPMPEEPADTIFSPDNTTVNFVNPQFQPDTKYVVLLIGAKSASTGETLDRPYVISFTTGSALPERTVSGTVTATDPIDAVVMLNVFGDEGQIVTMAATVVDANDGTYSIPYVAEGTYNMGMVVKDTDGDGAIIA